MLAATAQHKIDYLPGSAELGDFDATSTTIALAPGGEQGQLPADLLHGTFERYWTEFVQRRDGQREWKDYTPYEWRNVAAFVRLGWRERAWEVLDFFFKDRAPQAWNQWAEVVSRTPRARRSRSSSHICSIENAGSPRPRRSRLPPRSRCNRIRPRRRAWPTRPRFDHGCPRD